MISGILLLTLLHSIDVIFYFTSKVFLNPRTYRGQGVDATPHKVFLSFFLEDKTSATVVFSSCPFIARADFEMSLVIVSCYGYEICRHK